MAADKDAFVSQALGYSGAMTTQAGDIVIIGGASRIGQELVARLGTRARPVTRAALPGVCAVVVKDYAAIDAALLTGASTVINCVGASSGNPALLDRLNATLPPKLAEQAKAAGARHFVHISSFSVYGAAEMITAATPLAPSGDYGRSKLAGDTALLALADEGFTVSVLRLPLVYGIATPGKLGQLLAAWRRLGSWPVPSGDVRRAMIADALAADVIVKLLGAPVAGVCHAADPQPFSYASAAQAIGGARSLTIPRPVAALLRTLLPALGNRLFASSALDPRDNLAARYGLPSPLNADMAAIAERLTTGKDNKR